MSGAGPPPFSVAIVERGGRSVVAVTGELDLATAPELEAVLLPAVREGGTVVVDLRELAFMDSTGVRVLIAAHHAAAEHGGRLALMPLDAASPAGRVLDVSGLTGVLAVVDAD